jgi:nucleotide-binding universal stress UspA family protein
MSARAEPIRRLLVALDTSLHSLAALETAAQLAGPLEAELTGLFVEDADLLKLAGLPFVREIHPASATAEPLDATSLERALRLRAEQAGRALAAAAEHAKLRSSFRVVRGSVAAELLSAASAADLLVLGRGSRLLARHWTLGSTAFAVATRAARVLLVRSGVPCRGRPLYVLDDGTPSAELALRAATALAEALGSDLTILVAPGAPGAGAVPRDDAPAASRRTRVRRSLLHELDAREVARAVQRAGDGLLVLGSRGRLGQESIHELLDEVEVPVLLVQ